MTYSERISPIGLNLNDALCGSLPSIDVLRQYYADQLGDDTRRSFRMAKSKYISHDFRSKLNYGASGRTEFIDPKNDVLSVLLIDSISYMSWQLLLENKQEKTWDKGDLDELFEKMLTARGYLQSHIGDYEEIFKGAPDPVLYEALSAIFYDSFCLLNNNADMGPGPLEPNIIRHNLSGLLAEHKVIKALRSGGYDNVRYASVSEDNHRQWDVVIPGDRSLLQRTISVQVKAVSTEPDAKLEIVSEKNHITVYAPMRRELHQQFSFMPEEVQQLLEEVYSLSAQSRLSKTRDRQ